ncbi:MAG TPA: hypothetical protein VJ725_20280, partial [Thermoanaerobaculia bacterium]|nr:hypothetical protein [Thermoanaerobaculia bacterium]
RPRWFRSSATSRCETEALFTSSCGRVAHILAMNKKSESDPPSSDSEPRPEPPREITHDPEQFDGLLQDVVDSVRKYRESQRQKEDPAPEPTG